MVSLILSSSVFTVTPSRRDVSTSSGKSCDCASKNCCRLLVILERKLRSSNSFWNPVHTLQIPTKRGCKIKKTIWSLELFYVCNITLVLCTTIPNMNKADPQGLQHPKIPGREAVGIWKWTSHHSRPLYPASERCRVLDKTGSCNSQQQCWHKCALTCQRRPSALSINA